VIAHACLAAALQHAQSTGRIRPRQGPLCNRRNNAMSTRGGVQAKQTAVAPLTSFDWASFDTARIITSSIDCTCCLWDVEARLCPALHQRCASAACCDSPVTLCHQ
jgi:hypothetical protein